MVYRAPNYQCSNSCYFLLFVTLFLKITSVLHETFLNVLDERHGEFAVIEDFRVINSFTRHSFYKGTNCNKGNLSILKILPASLL